MGTPGDAGKRCAAWTGGAAGTRNPELIGGPDDRPADVDGPPARRRASGDRARAVAGRVAGAVEPPTPPEAKSASHNIIAGACKKIAEGTPASPSSRRVTTVPRLPPCRPPASFLPPMTPP